MHERSRFRRFALLACAMLSLPAVAAETKTPAVVDFTSCSRPVWPKEALRLQQQGAVTLGFQVDADGTVTDSRITRSSGFPLLDAAAREGIMKCRLKAATQDGKAVGAWMNIQYVWTLDPQRKPAAVKPFDKAAVMAAAEGGDAKAQVTLARYLMRTTTADFAPQRGVELLRTAVAAGEPLAMEHLAGLLATGTAVPKDRSASVALFRQAAEAGLAYSQMMLGVALVQGDGVPKDERAGEAWLRKAAAQGHARGQAWLASLLLRRAETTPEAVGLLKLAVEKGDLSAQRLLGSCNEHGTGIPQDHAAAADLYRKAAASGDNEAKKDLARLYGKGQGVPLDKVVAAALEREAAAVDKERRQPDSMQRSEQAVVDAPGGPQ